MNATALITGGTGGLGTAVVDAFLADGWRACHEDHESLRDFVAGTPADTDAGGRSHP